MTAAPRVFIVQQPTRRDPATGAISPAMDLTPAAEWGELHFILRENENPFADLQATAQAVERKLVDNEFCDGDWLVMVGNPALIAVVASVASHLTGELRLLQWQRNRNAGRGGYDAVVVELSDLLGEAQAA